MSMCTLGGPCALLFDSGVAGDARVGRTGCADAAANSAEESVEERGPPEASLLETAGLVRLDAAALRRRVMARPLRRAGAIDRLVCSLFPRSRSPPPPPPADPAAPADPALDAIQLVVLVVSGVAELLAAIAPGGRRATVALVGRATADNL